MSTRDVIVVGAGPAGAAAATTLAEAGLDVALIDKATFPRDKICGDGLTALALRILEDLDLDPLAVDNWRWVDDCRVRSPSGHSIHLPLPRADGHHAAVVPRVELDNALLERARKAGAHVIEGTAVTGATESNDHVEVELAIADSVDGIGSMRAPWVVAADGMWSPMRKYLGVAEAGYLGEWHAFRQYFSGVTGTGADELVVLFEADLLPGYFWSFPLPGNRANVGFGIQRGGKVAVREMKALWADLLQRAHVQEVLGEGAEGLESHRAWPIPARIDSLVPATDRAMFVGDAVGACDVMTGEGIGQALLSGVLAAREIIADGPHGRTAANRYATAVRADLVADHRMSELLVRALRHRKGARTAVRVAGLTPWTRRNFARWLFEDYPRAVMTTPRRWSRHMLTPPGSYRTHPR
jgi:geranylgeranyl reductase family protein